MVLKTQRPDDSTKVKPTHPSECSGSERQVVQQSRGVAPLPVNCEVMALASTMSYVA